MNKFNFCVKSTVVAMLLWATPVVAEGIPATMLLKEKTECKQECSLSGNGEMVCDTLCSCTVDQFNKLSLAQFQDMKAQLEAEAVTAALQSYLANVGAQCVADLDRVINSIPKPPMQP